jgi:hypothetical protein
VFECLGRGPLKPAEVVKICGLGSATVGRHLRHLKDHDLIERVDGRWQLTAKGIAKSGKPLDPGGLNQVLALLPSEAHRALARLIIDAILVRWHHAHRGDGNHLSFALYGTPGSFKTVLALVLSRLLGLEDYYGVVLAEDCGRAELSGRKVPDGKGGWRWEPAAVLGQAFLTVDELDKATGEESKAAKRLLQGNGVYVREGRKHVAKATVLAMWNTGTPREILPPDRLRRTVAMCADGLSPRTEIGEAAHTLLALGALPVLDIDRFIPSTEPVLDKVAAFFREDLAEYLTPEALAVYPAHELSLLVAGRACFEDLDVEQTANEIGFDYLVTARTWAGTDDRRIAAYCRDHGLTVKAALIGVDSEISPASARAVEGDELREAVKLAEELAEMKEAGRLAVADELAELGKPTDREGIRLVAAFKEVARRVRSMKSVAEFEPLSIEFDGLYERAYRRAEQIAGQRAMGSRSARAPRRAVKPDRLAMLLQLRDAGHKDAPAKVLSRLGLVVEDPFPVGTDSPLGRRWRGTVPGSTGAVVFDADGWTEASVMGILDIAIAAERAARAVAGATIMLERGEYDHQADDGPPALMAG